MCHKVLEDFTLEMKVCRKQIHHNIILQLLKECKQSHSWFIGRAASQGELIKIDVMVEWHSLEPEAYLRLL